MSVPEMQISAVLHNCWMCKQAIVCQYVCHGNFQKVVLYLVCFQLVSTDCPQVAKNIQPLSSHRSTFQMLQLLSLVSNSLTQDLGLQTEIDRPSHWTERTTNLITWKKNRLQMHSALFVLMTEVDLLRGSFWHNSALIQSLHHSSPQTAHESLILDY